MKVSVIVINNNGAANLSNCLISVSRLTDSEMLSDIVVVDMGSSDDSLAILKKSFPHIQIVMCPQNYGRGDAANRGIRHVIPSHADYIWIIDSHVNVDKDSMQQLITVAEKHRDSVVFGHRIIIDHQLWYAGAKIDWETLNYTYLGQGEKDTGLYTELTPTDLVPLESFFARSIIFKEVGFFNPDYFVFYDTLDFAQRCRRIGWRILFLPQPVVTIVSDPASTLSSSAKEYFLTRNRIYFGLKYGDFSAQLKLLVKAVKLYFSGTPWQRRAVLDVLSKNLGPGSYEAT
jgi:GT2 family glycosyltransferase